MRYVFFFFWCLFSGLFTSAATFPHGFTSWQNLGCVFIAIVSNIGFFYILELNEDK